MLLSIYALDSCYREANIRYGGPDGGDGGVGGSVVFAASRAVRSLASLNNSYKAGVGGKGSGDNCHGKRGKDVRIEVRVNTATTLWCKLLCGQRSL